MSRDAFVPGQWNFICDRCGRAFKSGVGRRTWDGLYTCPRCWEPRHPQDYVKGREERPVPPWVRPRRDTTVHAGPRRVPALFMPPIAHPGMTWQSVLVADGSSVLIPGTGDSGLIQYDTIDFTEYSIGTANPVYDSVLGDYYNETGFSITFGSYFMNQSPGTPASLVVGSPSNPLTLDLDGGPGVFIATDTARTTTSPCLSGTPFLSGSIAALFSHDVSGVAFDIGYINAVGGLKVRLYARDGTLLGTWTDTRELQYTSTRVVPNTGLDPEGFQQFALVRRNTSVGIAGVLVDGSDASGFSVDNLRLTSSLTTLGTGDITRLTTAQFP